MNEDEATPKKKSDKTTDGLTVSLDKSDKKEKSETEEPKPRIVLTFRSEKSNTKSANMKIVSTEEKQEEVSPRRSSRTRGKWDWVCDSDTSISPRKDKSQPVSENDESDSSHAAPKRTRRRSRDDNILASAIARKEKLYNETPAPTQRLSRRIKPTAKILANEELRMGLESQNNARLGIQAEKSPEEGVRTRRSARPTTSDTDKPKPIEKVPAVQAEVVELDSDSQNSDMKLQHLCKLGLKAIDPEEAEAEADDDEGKDLEEEDETELLDEEEEEIDDDSEVISKLLEADEETADEDDDEFLCTVATSKGARPRRSTRLCSGFGVNESDRSSPVPDEVAKGPSTRRSARKAGPDDDDSGRSHRTRRKRRHSEDELVVEAECEDGSGRSHRTRRKRRLSEDEVVVEAECEDGSNPAGAEEGTEAACPEEQSTVVAKCFCETPSNVYAEPKSLTEPIFCQAIETVEGVRVGCSHPARRSAAGLGALLRAGPRAPFALLCGLHAAQLARHMCCPACGLYCSQGTFYQCSEGHLFHTECGISYDAKSLAGCPHCGVYSYRWQPANTNCWKVQLKMTSSNKRVFLPDQREQCTQAYLGFTTLSVQPEAPSIPEDLLPSPAELKLMCSTAAAPKCSPEDLCEAILKGEKLSKLIPMILSGCDLGARVESVWGGTCVHACARRGHAGALHALHAHAAPLDTPDRHARTPLVLATLALLDKSELKLKPRPSKSPDSMEVDKQEGDSQEAHDTEDDDDVKEEDLLKVIRYLVAAGADVNLADQSEGLTALHIAARHGSAEVCRALLAAPAVEVDARDAGGWTPLVWAAENGHTQVLRLLLSHGASATTEDKEGNCAVHWCALAGAHAALHVLLHAGGGAARANAHTDTPLHIAARQGHYACVVTLLARGARSDVENSAGELPLDVATGACARALALNMQMRAHTHQPAHCRLLDSDISNGRELHPVPCVNEIDDTPAPSDFTYVTHHVTPYPVSVDYTIQSLQGCSCSGGSCDESCACVALGVQQWWRGSRLAPNFPYYEPPMLFQCNATCRCNPKLCGNSVISRLTRTGSVFVRCEVYRVGGSRGWGLRASATVPRGTPVAAYTGELLPMSKADTRTQDTYMFALDVKQDLLEQCTGDDITSEPLCVDACQYGGAARFINHSCAPNLAPVRVFTNTRDLRLPTVALLATRDIAPGEQLTFDYGDKFWSVKSKLMRCECGAVECRYPPDTATAQEAPA